MTRAKRTAPALPEHGAVLLDTVRGRRQNFFNFAKGKVFCQLYNPYAKAVPLRCSRHKNSQLAARAAHTVALCGIAGNLQFNQVVLF